MQIVTMYKTVDGKLFDCEIKAKNHEQQRNATILLVDSFDIYEEDVVNTLEYIRNNKDVFSYLFD